MNIRLFQEIYPIIEQEAPALALMAASCVLSNTHAIALSTLYVGYQWLSKPVSVTAIYSLQKKGDLAPYAEKVEQIRGKSNLLGIAFLPNEKVIYLTKRQSEGCAVYRAYDLTTREEVGEAITSSRLSFDLTRVIEIDHIENLSETHKNVGSVLIKTILQDTWKTHAGRIHLFSYGSSEQFYLKLGFHPFLLNYLAANTPGGWFYLPEQARALWRKEIEENPIK